jgi:hypothetical protein
VTDVILYFDSFGRRTLDHLATRRCGSRDVAVRTAARYYMADREAERAAWGVPSFAAAIEHRTGVTVEVDESTRGALTEEANRQGVRLGTLAAHAVLYYAADLDSGRLTGRLEHALHDGN